MQQAYYPPPAPPVRPQNNRSVLLWIGLAVGAGCLALLAGVGGVGYLIYRTFQSTLADGDAVARPFLATIDRGDDRAANEMMCPEARKAQTYPAFRAWR